VKEFWSITVYDMATSALFRNSERLAVSSTDKAVQKNPDGSVDVYFGPQAPAGKEANWVYTAEGKNWPVVPLLWSGKSSGGQELEDAGHRDSELNRFEVEWTHRPASPGSSLFRMPRSPLVTCRDS
jgi:hypothetical protein